MATSKRNSGSKNHGQAPPGAMEMLADMYQRIVRIETRQARQMLAQGMDTEGHPLPPQLPPAKQGS